MVSARGIRTYYCWIGLYAEAVAVTETGGKPPARPSDLGCLPVSLNLSISICKIGVMLFVLLILLGCFNYLITNK